MSVKIVFALDHPNLSHSACKLDQKNLGRVTFYAKKNRKENTNSSLVKLQTVGVNTKINIKEKCAQQKITISRCDN